MIRRMLLHTLIATALVGAAAFTWQERKAGAAGVLTIASAVIRGEGMDHDHD